MELPARRAVSGDGAGGAAPWPGIARPATILLAMVDIGSIWQRSQQRCVPALALRAPPCPFSSVPGVSTADGRCVSRVKRTVCIVLERSFDT
jgi:hypothetical protein